MLRNEEMQCNPVDLTDIGADFANMCELMCELVCELVEPFAKACKSLQ